MKNLRYAILLLAAASIFAVHAQAQVIVIANPSVKATEVTKNDLRDVFTGASTASEVTAAAQDHVVGTARRDPMAMLPFCGYNMGDYFNHWLSIGRKLSRPPKIFRVNWFRKGSDDQFLWPGFGENLRVLVWILERCSGRALSQTTPLGEVPAPDSLPLRGLDLSRDAVKALLAVDSAEWRGELAALREYFAIFGDRLPSAFLREMDALAARLGT